MTYYLSLYWNMHVRRVSLTEMSSCSQPFCASWTLSRLNSTFTGGNAVFTYMCAAEYILFSIKSHVRFRCRKTRKRSKENWDNTEKRQSLVWCYYGIGHGNGSALFFDAPSPTSDTLGVFGLSRATSAPRRPLVANPNIFRNPNMVFESITKLLFPMAPVLQIPRSTETESLIDSSIHSA